MTSAPRTKASIMTPEAKTISGHLLYKEAVEVEDLVAEEDREAASLVAKTLTLSRYPTSSRKTVHKFCSITIS